MLASCRPNLARISQARNTHTNTRNFQNTASTQGKCNAKHLQTRQGRQRWADVAGQQIWRTDRGHPASSLPQEKKERAQDFNAEVRTEKGHSVAARAIYHLLTL